MWRNWNPYAPLIGMQNGTARAEDSIEILQKITQNYYDPTTSLQGTQKNRMIRKF